MMARREGASPPRARKPRAGTSSAGDATDVPSSEADMQEALEPQPTKRPPGRPPGRRAVAARHTVYLDEARQESLARLAQSGGRSVHSLILEAIDDLVRKRGD